MALRYSTRTTTLDLDTLNTRVTEINALTSFNESDLMGLTNPFNESDAFIFSTAVINARPIISETFATTANADYTLSNTAVDSRPIRVILTDTLGRELEQSLSNYTLSGTTLTTPGNLDTLANSTLVSITVTYTRALTDAESSVAILNTWLPLNELIFKSDEGLIFTRTSTEVIQLGGGPVSTEAPATGSEEVGDTFIDTVNGNTFNFWNGTEFVTLQPSFGIFNSSGGQIWPV